MASQVVNDVRGSGYTLCRRQTYEYHRIENSRSIHPEEGSLFKEHSNIKGAKRGTNNIARQLQAQKLHRLGFSYLTTSFIYLVTKVKVFYNGFLGDVATESKMGSIEAPMGEPYFSVPVLAN